MSDKIPKFANVNVGDTLKSIQLGECEVIDINAFDYLTITCENEQGRCYYSLSGKASKADKAPSLYFPDEFDDLFLSEKEVPEVRGFAMIYRYFDRLKKVAKYRISKTVYLTKDDAIKASRHLEDNCSLVCFIEIEPPKKLRKVITWEEVK